MSQGLDKSLWEPGERVISFWCVEGMRAAFLEETLGEQRLASLAHGWEGERDSRREHNWGKGLEVEFVSWVE